MSHSCSFYTDLKWRNDMRIADIYSIFNYSAVRSTYVKRIGY